MTVSVNSNNITRNAVSFKGAPIVVKSKKVQNAFEWMGGLSTPANRMFLGATALAIQPFIDLHNKDVDKDTRKVSCARTIAKIIVGTLTGIYVRKWCISAMKNFTRTPEDLKEMAKKGKKITKWSTIMTPSHISPEKFGKAIRLLDKHRNALGSIVALGVMLFTNFLIDAPLTGILTNLLTDKIKNSDKGGK